MALDHDELLEAMKRLAVKSRPLIKEHDRVIEEFDRLKSELTS